MGPMHQPIEPIAIIGMGMRLPGGICSADQFWELLISKKDGRCQVPKDRYNVGAFYSANKKHQQNIATDHGYFLQTNVKGFDTSVFGTRRAELAVTDPQVRLLHEVVWECMESAGLTSLRGTNTGVFVGVFGEDWHNMLYRDAMMPNNFRVLSAGDYALANMLSWEFDLSGPSMTLRTACSSSLSALHIACQSLHNGDCPTAIVAGSSIILDPTMTLDMSELGILSPSGSCKTFDAAADGFARGEAVNALLLKPLSAAFRDGDPVRAVIRSTAVNSDGKTPHIGSPSTEAQMALIRRAYERAGITDLSQTPFVECHGTGTVRGDPMEVAAVGNVFGRRGTYIGSVKPNVGHGEGAAALTSIIKAVLSLENETIPPNVNFHTPNPRIPFEEYNLQVPIEPIPWPIDRQPRISISSFGIGGANGHVILDSAASFGGNRGVGSPLKQLSSNESGIESGSSVDVSTDDDDESAPEMKSKTVFEKLAPETPATAGVDVRGTKHQPDDDAYPLDPDLLQKRQDATYEGCFLYLVPVSAGNCKSLQRRLNDIQEYIKSRPQSLANIVHTLALKRDHLPYRGFCVATLSENKKLDITVHTEIPSGEGGRQVSDGPRKVVFVFTGQGSHWTGMAKSLIERCKSFRQDIQNMDACLQCLVEKPTWSLEVMLRTDGVETTESLQKAEFSQPLCTAVQVAVFNFLASCGVTPTAVVGHSSGEIAAAYAAGALNMKEAIVCAYLRGRSVSEHARQGKMAVVGLSAQDAEGYLSDGVQVACDNSPCNVTISGDADALDRTLEAISADNAGVFSRALPVNVAYHSHHMREAAATYEKELAVYLTSSRHVQCPFYSTVSGKLHDFSAEPLNAEYWRRNLESPVLFKSSVQQLLRDHTDITQLLEIGPHSALRSPIREILQSKTSKMPDYLATIRRGNDPSRSLLAAVGQLYAHGYDVDFSRLCSSSATILTDLPTYPWDREGEFWRESRLSHAWRHRKHGHHELLGSRCVETSEIMPLWRNILHHFDVPWLADHKVGPDVVFPVAGFIAMMGEAVRQITGVADYQLRNVTVKSALIMADTEPIELLTSLRPMRLTARTNSNYWFELSISQFDGVSWVENCVAQGKASTDMKKLGAAIRRTKEIAPYLRKVPKSYFYDRMRHIGLAYGPRFQGLEEISAHTDESVAVGQLRNDQTAATTGDGTYALHPATIDCCFQLCVVAQSQGIARNIDSLALPVVIENVLVRAPGPANPVDLEPELLVEATIDPVNKLGSSIGVSKNNNEIMIELRNGQCVPFNIGHDDVDGKSVLHASRLHWLPDIDFVDYSGLMQRRQVHRDSYILAERAAILGILLMTDTLQHADEELSSQSSTVPKHFWKYISWLRAEHDIILNEDRAEIAPEAHRWVAMNREARTQALESLLSEVEGSGNQIVYTVTKSICKLSDPDVLWPIIRGETSPLEIVIGDGWLPAFYELGNSAVDLDHLFHLLGHGNPGLRVLEIGAGTAATSEVVLSSLVSDGGVRMYSRYVFTDISAGFFKPAEERLARFDGLEYRVLDIEKDLEEQGFTLGSFDLVVASNVLHVTSSIQTSLKNVRSLLKPGGRLFLQELVEPMPWRSLSMGTGLLPGWWMGENDGRVNTPTVTLERWSSEIQAAGFSGIDAVLLDDDPPYHFCGNMVSTRSLPAINVPRKCIVLLYHEKKSALGLQLAKALDEQDISIHWVKLNESGEATGESGHHDIISGSADYMAQGHDIICTFDLEGKPFLADISEDDYNAFMKFLRGLHGGQGILWLTGAAHFRCSDPGYGIGLGLFRTIRNELGLDFWTVEMDSPDTSAASQAAWFICQKFLRRPSIDDTDRKIDTEYAVSDGVVLVGRYHWTSTLDQLESSASVDPKQMMIGHFGRLNSMHWVQRGPQALEGDQVEVNLKSSGLNFKDVMVAMGIVLGEKHVLGYEAAGEVARIGQDVHSVKVGDRVMVFGQGLFATKKVLPASQLMPIPDGLSFEEAATLPVAYATAAYALISLGQLSKGQTVLIHSGAGGVGQAAIHIAQLLGAEIYTTVRNDEKAQHIFKTYGISHDRIFDSHSTSFLEDVMAATNDRGVDIVLNSLSGDLLHASWECVAANGKMLEIGKRDMLEHGHLAMDLFQANRTFFGVDIEQVWKTGPEILLGLLDRLNKMNFSGHLKPIQPIHTFSMDKAAEALQVMKKGQHMGKIVLNVPEEPESIPAAIMHEPNLFSSTSTYLLVGGLGGLGKQVTRWMVESGARSICFLSRSAGTTSQDIEFITELQSQGCRVMVVAGSISDIEDVKRAVTASPTPIKGVLQLSMVLRDLPLLDITYRDWRAVQDPKVLGTWNLHKALLDTELDFFILMSSIVGLAGQPGQANYASANTFLDSFMHYRHSLSLPCSVVDLGGVEGIGFLTTRPDKLNQYRSSGLYFLQEEQVIESVRISIKHSRASDGLQSSGPRGQLTAPSQISMGLRSKKALSDPRNTRIFTGDIRFGMYVNMDATDQLDNTASRDEELRVFLNEVEEDSSILCHPDTLPRVSLEIGRTLFRFLSLPEEDLDVNMTLESIGVDSLVSVEIRNWWRRTIGLEISVLEILKAGTIEGLGKKAISALQEKYSTGKGMEKIGETEG